VAKTKVQKRRSEMKCQEVCIGFKSIGEDACLGCAGMEELEYATRKTIQLIAKGLRPDGRCKHGMIPGTCSYCAGIKMTPYTSSGRGTSYFTTFSAQKYKQGRRKQS
jgi:hypothetical protein